MQARANSREHHRFASHIRTRDGSTHAAADTARLVLHHGADRLTVDAELCRDGPSLAVLAAMQAPDHPVSSLRQPLQRFGLDRQLVEPQDGPTRSQLNRALSDARRSP